MCLWKRERVGLFACGKRCVCDLCFHSLHRTESALCRRGVWKKALCPVLPAEGENFQKTVWCLEMQRNFHWCEIFSAGPAATMTTMQRDEPALKKGDGACIIVLQLTCFYVVPVARAQLFCLCCVLFTTPCVTCFVFSVECRTNVIVGMIIMPCVQKRLFGCWFVFNRWSLSVPPRLLPRCLNSVLFLCVCCLM